jgi:hypothetical protein
MTDPGGPKHIYSTDPDPQHCFLKSTVLAAFTRILKSLIRSQVYTVGTWIQTTVHGEAQLSHLVEGEEIPAQKVVQLLHNNFLSD